MSVKNAIIQCMRQLQSYRPFFISEDDLKFSLATELRDRLRRSNIFLEFPMCFPSQTNKIYIDIMIEEGGQFYPIELKWKTMPFPHSGSCNFHSKIAMSLPLEDHSCQTSFRALFYSDIGKIEHIKRSNCFPWGQGYAIFFTNVHACWSSQRQTKCRLDEGHTIKEQYHKDKQYTIDGQYISQWEFYSCVGGGGDGETFKYLTIEIT